MTKPIEMQQLISEAINILTQCGIPVETMTPRRKERMAMCFLVVAGVTKSSDWHAAKSISDGVVLKTRSIIPLINSIFNETISDGSYDDIRRQDLLLPVMANLIVQTSPTAARNSPTRGYALSEEMCLLVRHFGLEDWDTKVKEFTANHENLTQQLTKARQLHNIPVKINDSELTFSPGEHNLLQKYIIEEFLPRFGYGCEILYVGDTADKYLYLNSKKLNEIKFFELSHGELPDVVAYSEDKNWLYLIEAFHSTGPMSATRVHKLKKLLNNCACELIFITAFLDRLSFKKQAAEIAWESEVWIADNPDHMIHFNGHKFMGPHSINK
jgi:hypothetical protein